MVIHMKTWTYEFTADLRQTIQAEAKRLGVGEHEIFERALALYFFSQELQDKGGRLIAERKDGAACELRP